jgi:hypothetical protein
MLLYAKALLDAALTLTSTEPSFVQMLQYCVGGEDFHPGTRRGDRRRDGRMTSRHDEPVRRPRRPVPAAVAPEYHRQRSWWKANWMTFVLVAVTIVTNLWNGTNWLHARESEQAVTKADIQRLEAALRDIPNTYVRQDVFTQVLVQIRDRLQSLDNKKDAGNR